MAKLTKTSTPGIFRRHVQGCPNEDNSSRCDCNYAVPKRHRGKQVMETFVTFGEAREAKGKKDAGDTRPRSRERFDSYFETWIDTYAGRTKRGFEEETRTEYRRSIANEALPRWGNIRLADLDQGDVKRLYAEMAKAGKSHAAMKKVRAALSPLFNTAIEDRIIDFNPVTGVKIPAPPKAVDAGEEDDERGKALTREELAAFLAAVPADWRLFFEFLTVTGLRIGEAIGLTWEDVVLSGDSPRVKVRQQIYEGRRKRYLKSDAGKREIPLTPESAQRLLEHRRDAYKGPKSPLFATRTGTPLRPSNVYRRVLAPAAIEAGIYVEVPDPKSDKPELRKKTAIAFHAFRHTCASLLFAGERNVKQVSEWLGHTDPGFTLRVYIHLLDDGLGGGINLPPVVPDDASGVHGVDLGVDLKQESAA